MIDAIFSFILLLTAFVWGVFISLFWFAISAIITGFFVFILWNAIIPVLFVALPAITFWQAVGINLLIGILFNKIKI